MGKATKSSRLAGIPAWALSSWVALSSLIFLWLLFDETGAKNLSSTYLFIMSLGLVTLFTVACFIICKRYPKSVWYSPLICNLFVISSFIFGMPFWTRSSLVWIILGIGLILSLAAAIAGARSNKIE